MEVNCVRVVFETSSGGFVVVVEDFGLVLWCGWRMMELCGVGMRGGERGGYNVSVCWWWGTCMWQWVRVSLEL